MKKVFKQLEQCVLAFDQFLSTLVGLVLVIFGAAIHWADETLSARAYRQRHQGHWWKLYKVINTIFFWQEDHCEGAYLSELARNHMPPEYRVF